VKSGIAPFQGDAAREFDLRRVPTAHHRQASEAGENQGTSRFGGESGFGELDGRFVERFFKTVVEEHEHGSYAAPGRPLLNRTISIR